MITWLRSLTIFVGNMRQLNQPKQYSSSNAASSSNVAMSDDFCDLDYTSLIINDESIEMVACLGPQSHGGDAGGDPPQRPTKRIPSQCEGSGKRGVSKHQNLKKSFKNNGGPIELEFEWKDQETFKALGTHG
ncbi:hypothetical protein Tco_0314617, partial [Tanacetum coccineum]